MRPTCHPTLLSVLMASTDVAASPVTTAVSSYVSRGQRLVLGQLYPNKDCYLWKTLFLIQLGISSLNCGFIFLAPNGHGN